MEMNDKMLARQRLLAEMESLKSQAKLTPEERRKEVKRQTYDALKALEMERRQRVAQEEIEKCNRDREERERVAQKAEEERKQKQDQLEEERLQWESLMNVEGDVTRPRYTLSALEEEQEERQEELCRVPMGGYKAHTDSLTSDLQPAELKRETLYNNWVGEEKLQPNSSIYQLFAARPGPKPEEKPKPPQSSGMLQWMQDGLRSGHWLDKYREHREKKSERRRLKAEEQYTRWSTYKSSRMSQCSQLNDCYTAGFATSRNSILKSTF